MDGLEILYGRNSILAMDEPTLYLFWYDYDWYFLELFTLLEE